MEIIYYLRTKGIQFKLEGTLYQILVIHYNERRRFNILAYHTILNLLIAMYMYSVFKFGIFYMQ